MISGAHSSFTPVLTETARAFELAAVARDQRAAGQSGPGRIKSDLNGKTSAQKERNPGGLTDAERQYLDKLRSRDQEVRAHEQAHMAAGAGLVRGGPNYTFTKGPDGKLYATGGSVQIDTSSAASAEESIEKARQIRAAALAPSSPSSQDLSVAARASMMEMQARGELDAEEETSEVEYSSSHVGHENAEDPTAEKSEQVHHSKDPAHLAHCPECRSKAFSPESSSKVEGQVLGLA